MSRKKTLVGIGLILALAYMHRTRCTKSFVATLALLPAVVCVVIMMVNGNVGTGVAVAGAFSLVRFRSVPGTAKEIGVLFLAMGVGLIAGMGYLAFAALFTVIMCAVFMLYNRLDFGAKKNAQAYKTLTITIPEELDYVVHIRVVAEPENVVVGGSGLLLRRQIFSQVGDGVSLHRHGRRRPGEARCSSGIDAHSVIHKVRGKGAVFHLALLQVSGQLVDNGPYHLQVAQFLRTNVGE